MIHSASAPVSLLASPRAPPIQVERKVALSAPASRRSSVTASDIYMLPCRAPFFGTTPVHAYSSPRSTLKKSGVSAFGRDRSRLAHGALCPVHSYAPTPSKEPPQRSWIPHAAVFPKSQRPERPSSAGPAVHAYQSQFSSMKRAGVSAFPLYRGANNEQAANQVHAYAAPMSTLSRSGATAFGTAKVREEPKTLCRVHSYSGLLDRVKQPAAGAATFGKDASSWRPCLAGSQVHAYAPNGSTLSRSGATFGRMPARPGHPTAINALSRTGLIGTHPAAVDIRRPRTAPPLPPAPPPQHRAAPTRPKTAPALVVQPRVNFPESSALEEEVRHAKALASSLFNEPIEVEQWQEQPQAQQAMKEPELAIDAYKPSDFEAEEELSPISITASPLPKTMKRSRSHLDAALDAARSLAASPAA